MVILQLDDSSIMVLALVHFTSSVRNEKQDHRTHCKMANQDKFKGLINRFQEYLSLMIYTSMLVLNHKNYKEAFASEG